MELIEIDSIQFGLSEIQATAIANKFLPVLEEMQLLLDKYAEIKDIEPTDPANSAKLKELRLKFVKCRTNCAKIHKEEKEFYKKGGQYVDSYKNKQLEITEPIEADLKEKEDYSTIQEMKRKELLRSERAELLRKWECEESNNPALGEIKDSTFEMILSGAETAHKNKIEAEKKAEISRIAKVKYDEEIQQEEMIWALYYQRIADNREAEESAKNKLILQEKAKNFLLNHGFVFNEEIKQFISVKYKYALVEYLYLNISDDDQYGRFKQIVVDMEEEQRQAKEDKEDAEYLAEYNIWQEYEKHMISEQEKADRLMFKNKAEQYLHDSGFDLINGLYQSKKYGFSLSPHYYNDLLSYSHFSSFKNQIDRLNKEAERESELKAENERKAEAEKQRLASLAPDKDKLTEYLNALRKIPMPIVTEQESKDRLKRFSDKMKVAIMELK